MLDYAHISNFTEIMKSIIANHQQTEQNYLQVIQYESYYKCIFSLDYRISHHICETYQRSTSKDFGILKKHGA